MCIRDRTRVDPSDVSKAWILVPGKILLCFLNFGCSFFSFDVKSHGDEVSGVSRYSLVLVPSGSSC